MNFPLGVMFRSVRPFLHLCLSTDFRLNDRAQRNCTKTEPTGRPHPIRVAVKKAESSSCAATAIPPTMQDQKQQTDSFHEIRNRANEGFQVIRQRTSEGLSVLKLRTNEGLTVLQRETSERFSVLQQESTARLSVLQERIRTNERYIEMQRQTNEGLVVLKHHTSTGLTEVQRQAILYQEALIQHRDQALVLLRDQKKREALLKKIKDHRTIRLWRTHILLPCILLLSLWNVLDFTLHSGDLSVVETAIDGAPYSRNDYGRRMTSVEAKAAIADTVIDIISVGSLLKGEYQDAQVRTFGTHPSVRSFYRVTERNDTDSTCFTGLTTDQLDVIIDFCTKTKDESFISSTLRKRLFQPKKHTGWMCAQKRPLDGLYRVLQQYAAVNRTGAPVPDYLFIIDDDTYINMDALTTDLLRFYPVDRPFVVAGCNFDFLKASGITFPYGGFGSYLTKAAIQRMLQPIYCDGRDDHSSLACWRLNLNALGEKQFFTEGMSVIELMQSYAAKLAFTNVESWTDTGYCFHSDHALAYFINFYHIPVPDGLLVEYGHKPKDKIRRRHSYVALAGGNETECRHEKENCLLGHRICHYTAPAQMDRLHAAGLAAAARNA